MLSGKQCLVYEVLVFKIAEFYTVLLSFVDTIHRISWPTLETSNIILRATGLAYFFTIDDEAHISFSSDFISAFQIFRFSSVATHHHAGFWSGLLSVGYPSASSLLWTICCASSGAYTDTQWNRLQNWSGWEVIIIIRKTGYESSRTLLWLAAISSQV